MFVAVAAPEDGTVGVKRALDDRERLGRVHFRGRGHFGHFQIVLFQGAEEHGVDHSGRRGVTAT